MTLTWLKAGPRKKALVHSLISVAVVWIVIQFGLQEGVFEFLRLLFKLLLLSSIVLALLGKSFAGPQVLLPVLSYVLWYQVASPYSVWRDIAFLALVVVIGNWGLKERSPRQALAWGLTLTLVSWFAISAADLLCKGGTLPRDKNRFTRLLDTSPWKRKRVGMALSGGGYRAALLEAGVLDGLERMGVVPTYLSTVSGGSIIGSYYAVGGQPESFLRAVHENRFGLAREVTNLFHAIHMLACPLEVPTTHVKLIWGCEYGRSEVQADLLDRVLLSETRVAELASQLPKLIVCVTELADGGQFGISPYGLAYVEAPTPQTQFRFANRSEPKRIGQYVPAAMPRDLRLATVVAASGAFPGALNAVRLSFGDLEIHAIDGGLTDNSGLDILLTAAHGGITDVAAGHDELEAAKLDRIFGATQRSPWAMDIILAVDGGMAFGRSYNRENKHSTDENIGSTLAQLSRAIDVIYNGVGQPPRFPTEGPTRLLLSPANYLQRDGKTPDVTACAQAFNELQSLSRNDPRLRYLTDDSWKDELNASLRANKDKIGAIRYSEKNALGSLRRCLEMFVIASTLKDRYEEYEAKRIFQLGRMLVALNWTAIHAELERPSVGQPD